MARIDRRRIRDRFDEEEDINPLTYMANMSDAMLILAVGIMLALIVHWNVDISTTGGGAGTDPSTAAEAAAAGAEGDEQVNVDNAISFQQSNMEEVEDSSSVEGGTGMSKLGEVYFDAASGKYYVIKDDKEQGE